jgi:methionyl-tRNA formyltransferase
MARLVFAGSPSVATSYLRELAIEHDIVCVVTRADAPVGRKRVLTPTPVASAADELGLTVLKTNSLKGVALPAADLGVVVAYGGMVPTELLHHPATGWVNVHFSMLPALRGAAPVQRGLWNGDKETGITVFSLVDELDAGPVFYQRPIAFEENETASDALHRIARYTAPEVADVVNRIINGELTASEQAGAVSFAPKFSREDARIDWTRDAVQVLDRIRAVTTEPGAFTVYGTNMVTVIRARSANEVALRPGEVSVVESAVCVGTATTAVELVTVKPAGRSEMSGSDWARGLHDSVRFS